MSPDKESYPRVTSPVEERKGYQRVPAVKKPLESKKLSQSFVVYHQMKKNLMQTTGANRGSRYYPPGLSGPKAPVSQENVEEQLNTLLLDTTKDKEEAR